MKESDSPLLSDAVRPYYRDYIAHVDPDGYRSLHITFFDNSAKCYMEMQLRTKRMDDIAEIGPANHLGYEKKQESDRARRDAIPEGECVYFDEAYERCPETARTGACKAGCQYVCGNRQQPHQ